jgi:hypothetical protein
MMEDVILAFENEDASSARKVFKKDEFLNEINEVQISLKITMNKMPNLCSSYCLAFES